MDIPAFSPQSLISNYAKLFENKTEQTMQEASHEDDNYSTKLATAVSLTFESNSQLLDDIYAAVEMKII